MASREDPPQNAWGKTGDLVRTYKAINDPNAPPWSIRFVGGIAAVALLAAAVGALYVASEDAPGTDIPAASSATVRENADGTRTDYVGFPTNVAVAPDAVALDAAYAAWEAQHPGAQVVSKEPVSAGGRVTGWHVTYR